LAKLLKPETDFCHLKSKSPSNEKNLEYQWFNAKERAFDFRPFESLR
jgi:hypothetical protein